MISTVAQQPAVVSIAAKAFTAAGRRALFSGGGQGE
jgi:hypothetical protein